ncbi:MAG: GIY-YIG nuclease family protein [Solirubrobacteraceae bacterium]
MAEFLESLVNSPRHRVAEHPKIPQLPGIYFFTEDGRPLYVGQTRNLKSRLAQHTGERSRENQASLAFNIAKREAALAGVEVNRTRKALEVAPDFETHFVAARAHVTAMDVQFIELADPVTRTLFEVYASLVLRTAEFNSWETH